MSEQELMPEVGQTVFLTKYALTAGIKANPVAKVYNHGVGSIAIYIEGDSWSAYYLGREAFLDREAAVANAEARRVKKIASLQKQIGKLQKVTFA